MMRDQVPRLQRVREYRLGSPVIVGDHTLSPLVRLTAWQVRSSAWAVAGWQRSPIMVQVASADQAVRTVALPSEWPRLASTLGAALLMGPALSALVYALATRACGHYRSQQGDVR